MSLHSRYFRTIWGITEAKFRRDQGGVFPHDISPGQDRHVALEEGPEPLVDFDDGVLPSVLLE
jgi:hypothetical protein